MTLHVLEIVSRQFPNAKKFDQDLHLKVLGNRQESKQQQQQKKKE